MTAENLEPSPLTWLGGDRRLARSLGRPVRDFLQIEASGGLLLILATVVALVWANSPWQESYESFIHFHISLEFGSFLTIDEPLEAWVNDALMVVFFFVVGLEIKKELVSGELANPRAAALPAMAALGGMIVPALIFVAFNAGGVGADGWGIPMATDIAFAIGIISLLGDRVPKAMKVFLLTLAIVDDVGAIVVIAIFYTSDLSIGWSLTAVGLVALVLLMKLARIWYIPLYVLVGVVLWLAVFESGIHATIAGVVLGLICPAHPLRAYAADPCVDAADNPHVGSAIAGEANPRVIRRANFEIREQLSVAERLADLLHPFSSYLIIPLFALVNAGIEISSETLEDAVTSDITLGVVLGLIVGKFVGVSLFTWLGVRLGLAGLPQGATFRHVVGLALIAGIGFTVSLFITGLAFDDPMVVDEAKLGILGASVIAATLGSLVLFWAKPATGAEASDPDEPPHPEPAETH